MERIILEAFANMVRRYAIKSATGNASIFLILLLQWLAAPKASMIKHSIKKLNPEHDFSITILSSL
jgi:hypothetical protein